LIVVKEAINYFFVHAKGLHGFQSENSRKIQLCANVFPIALTSQVNSIQYCGCWIRFFGSKIVDSCLLFESSPFLLLHEEFVMFYNFKTWIVT